MELNENSSIQKSDQKVEMESPSQGLLQCLVFVPSPQKLPAKERQGHSAIVYSNQMIVFAGRTKNEKKKRSFVSDLWNYDLDQDKWYEIKAKGSLPSSRHNHTAVVFSDNMFVFGGSGYDGYYSDFFKFDIQKETWTQLPNTNGPCAVHGHSAVVYSNTMIVFGGKDTNSKYNNDIYVFNFDTNQWTCIETKGKKPPVRCWHSASVLNSYMIVFGGFYWDGHEHYYDDMFLLDLNTFEWKEIQPEGVDRPHARNRHSAVIISSSPNPQLFVFGGNYYNDQTRKGAFYSDSFVLEIDGSHFGKWKWSKVNSLGVVPTRAHHTCVSHNGSFYLLAGEQQRKVFNDLILLQPRVL